MSNILSKTKINIITYFWSTLFIRKSFVQPIYMIKIMEFDSKSFEIPHKLLRKCRKQRKSQ